MGQYLSNIAARNSENVISNLLPVTPDLHSKETGVAEDFAQESLFQNGGDQNQSEPQNIVPAQQGPLQTAEQIVVLNRQDKKEQVQNKEPNYFSKHSERLKHDDEGFPIKNIPIETLMFKTEKPRQKKEIEKVKSKNQKDGHDVVNKPLTKIVPEIEVTPSQTKLLLGDEYKESLQSGEAKSPKKQEIIPMIEKANEVKNKPLRDNTIIQRLTPVRPEKDQPKQPLSNHQNQPINKLIIGKIIVEILPPKQTIPQKVITRVVSSSPNENQPRSNKLIFGLGQL